MRFSPKHLASFLERLALIESGIFSESDIGSLLISIRDYVNQKSIIKELGHFVAHPERNQGFFFDELNWRAAVIKLRFAYPQPTILNLFEMPVAHFKVVCKTAIEKTRSEVLLQKIGMNQKDVLGLMSASYEENKKKKVYVLKDYKQLAKIGAVVNVALHTLYAMPIISIQSIILDLNKEVNLIIKQHAPSSSYMNTIAAQSRAIGLCLLSLLQGMTFALFDGSIGTLALDDHTFADLGKGFSFNDGKIKIFGMFPITLLNGRGSASVASEIIDSDMLWSSAITEESISQGMQLKKAAALVLKANEPIIWVVRRSESGVHNLYPFQHS